MDKYTMKDIHKCIGDIGRSESTIFTTLDLTSGFWQMSIHTDSVPKTAFTLPGLGQYEWLMSPMGLLGCPANFQRLMEKLMKKIDNIIRYIDDLLIHSETHKQYLVSLDIVRKSHQNQLEQMFLQKHQSQLFVIQAYTKWHPTWQR